MLSPRTIQNLRQEASQVRRWRCGQIVIQGGEFKMLQKRWFPRSVSVAEVWFRSQLARPTGDICCLDYHQPLGMSCFLVVDYIHSGAGSSLKTFLTAVRVLDEVARIRGTLAIVAHVSNASISDRLLERLGWERHQLDWPGRHWIRRFYGGYPPEMAF